MTASRYTHPVFEANFRSTPRQTNKATESPRGELLLEEARQPDAPPGRNLRRAAACAAETKRQVLLAQRQVELHRRKWQALSVVAKACDCLIATLARLDAM